MVPFLIIGALLDTLPAVEVVASPSIAVQSVSTAALPVSNLSDVAPYLTGVRVTNYGPGQSSNIYVRSLSNQHVGVYIDGVQMYNAQNNSVNLTYLTADSISLWSSSVCSFPSELAPAASIHLSQSNYGNSVSYTYGSYGYNDVAVSATHNNLSAHVDYTAFDGKRENSDYSTLSAALLYSKDHFKFRANLISSELGVPGSTTYSTPNDRQRDNNLYLQANYSNNYGPHSYKFAAKFSNEYMYYNSPGEWGYSNTYYNTDFYTGAAYTYSLPHFSVSTGADVHYSLLSAPNCMDHEYTVDAKGSATLHYYNKGFDAVGTLLYRNYNSSSHWSPSLSLSYTYNNFSVRGWFKDSYRVPNMNDLWYPNCGNPDLVPERALQYNVGISYNGLFNFSVDAYYNNITDRIVCLPPLYLMDNEGSVHSRGINASASYTYGSFTALANSTVQSDGTQPYNNHSLTGIYSVKGLTASLTWEIVGRSAYVDSYNTLAAKVSYAFPYCTLAVEGRNLTNNSYEVNAGYPMLPTTIFATLSFNL